MRKMQVSRLPLMHCMQVKLLCEQTNASSAIHVSFRSWEMCTFFLVIFLHFYYF